MAMCMQLFLKPQSEALVFFVLSKAIPVLADHCFFTILHLTHPALAEFKVVAPPPPPPPPAAQPTRVQPPRKERAQRIKVLLLGAQGVLCCWHGWRFVHVMSAPRGWRR